MTSDFQGARWTSPGEFSSVVLPGARFGFCGLNVGQPDAHYVKQIHGAKVLEASTATRRDVDVRPEADGIWTVRKSERIAVRTADCLPVLFSARKGAVVIAVHAGWRGLTGGILAEASGVIRAAGVGPDECDVVVGPAIGWDAFEIGPEVAEHFRKGTIGLSAKQVEQCLRPGRDDRWHGFLSGAAVLSLNNLGFRAGRIHAMATCTFHDRQWWHSYRREGDGFPMNWSWIERE